MRLAPALLGAALLLVPAASGAAGARHLTPVGTFASPVYVGSTPADASAIYVVEQAGRILRVAGGRRSTFLDVRGQVVAGGERGLLSIAFHPRYARNKLFYVDYTSRPAGNTVIAEFRARAAKRPLRLRTLMNLPDPAPNHNGGQLVFGPDGWLWWGNGDGGGGGDSYGNGQRADGYFAKIMRQDVDRRPARWVTWAVGLRNPWRFSFDRGGDLYIGDVGQSDWEEIDWVPGGRSHLNFGWNRYEGKAVYGGERLLDGWTLTPPVHVYSHDDGCSVTGGYVYRGSAVAGAAGRYFFGDYCNGRVWSLVVKDGRGGDVQREPFSVEGLSSFGVDARGELYLVSLQGPVYRLAG